MELSYEKDWPLRIAPWCKFEDYPDVAIKRTGVRPDVFKGNPDVFSSSFEWHAMYPTVPLGDMLIGRAWEGLFGCIMRDEGGPTGLFDKSVDFAEAMSQPRCVRASLMQKWLFVVHEQHEFFRVLMSKVHPLPDGKDAILAFPNHPDWSADDSLSLRFVAAVTRHEMTDELWAEAVAAWGETLTVTYCFLPGYYQWLVSIYNALGHTRWMGPLAGVPEHGGGTWPPGVPGTKPSV